MLDTINSTVADLNWPVTVSNHIHLDKIPSLSFDPDLLLYAWDLTREQLTISNAWKILLLLHIVANFKHFPFIYHLRILNAVRFVLRSQRPENDVKPEQLFQPIITSSRATLMEIDVYGHKSNSTYFADVDISRAHLVTTLFGQAIAKIRGSTTMNGLSNKSSNFTMALGAVSCSFRKEIKPYESYDLWTRIISWDEKWVYLVTHFVKKNAKITPRQFTLYPRQKNLSSESSSRQGSVASLTESTNGYLSALNRHQTPIVASALSKIVFKEGRKTIAPAVMLELAGLLPSRPQQEKLDDMVRAQIRANEHKLSPRSSVATIEKVEMSESDTESSRRSSMDETIQEWTWENIEKERLRGMSMAQLLGRQTELEDEFTDDAALGKHYDGFGIEGVCATLAQLGGFSRYQLL